MASGTGRPVRDGETKSAKDNAGTARQSGTMSRTVAKFLSACVWLFFFLLAPVMPLVEKVVLLLLSVGPVPRHIAIIMDGNRRYARNHPGGPMPVSQGHLSGFNALRSVLETCLKLRGLTTVSVYAFAINNFERDENEVNAIMDLAKRNLVQLASHGEVLARHSVRLQMIGRTDLLQQDVQRALEKVERMTSGNRRATLNVCIAYASSDEIAHAMERCIANHLHGGAPSAMNGTGQHDGPSAIRTDELDAEMMLAQSPPVDILIRTSDVHRFSDFMLWQIDQAQLQFTKRYWPLFGLRELIPIMLDYQRMIFRRRFEEKFA